MAKIEETLFRIVQPRTKAAMLLQKFNRPARISAMHLLNAGLYWKNFDRQSNKFIFTANDIYSCLGRLIGKTNGI